MNLLKIMESAFNTDPTLKEEMLGNPWRPWKGTLMEGYRQLDPDKKGAVGERIADILMAGRGHDIAPRANPGHDSIVDDIKTEYKFSAASKHPNKRNRLRQDQAILNHLSLDKDWERCVYTVINISEESLEQVQPSQIVPELHWFTKEDFEQHIAAGTGRGHAFSPQQGGKKVGNDDYMSDYKRLKKHGILRPISEW